MLFLVVSNVFGMILPIDYFFCDDGLANHHYFGMTCAVIFLNVEMSSSTDSHEFRVR